MFRSPPVSFPRPDSFVLAGSPPRSTSGWGGCRWWPEEDAGEATGLGRLLSISRPEVVGGRHTHAHPRPPRPRPAPVGGLLLPIGSQPPKEMKPHVTYQQLKTLRSPEEPPPTGQPSPALKKNFHCILVMAILSAMLLTAVVVHLLFLPLPGSAATEETTPVRSLGNRCNDPCRSTLVESIPEGLTFDDNSTLHLSTFEAWVKLMQEARSTMDMASFYWTLTDEDTHTQDPSASQGEEILAKLLKLPSQGISLRIAVNPPSSRMPSTDLQLLKESGAQIRQVNLPRLTMGILHTKFWIVDQTHFYLGSANMDWRALTQVKELGVVVYNCSCLAKDLAKMFEAYWVLGLPNATIPSPWPANYSTTYDKETPLELTLNGTEAGVYFSSAPPALCADGRTQDLQALLSVIDGAQEFLYIAVMSYLPTMEFSHPKRFWPVIDDHLRRTAYERRVNVRLLIGCWRHSKADMFPFLKSLAALNNDQTHISMEVRLFVVPANETQAKIPYARVNHSKFMVTDKVAYIGTSNWSGNYFLQTAGSALVVNQSQVENGGEPTLREQLQEVFERDWNSKYSQELNSLQQWQDICNPH